MILEGVSSIIVLIEIKIINIFPGSLSSSSTSLIVHHKGVLEGGFTIKFMIKTECLSIYFIFSGQSAARSGHYVRRYCNKWQDKRGRHYHRCRH